MSDQIISVEEIGGDGGTIIPVITPMTPEQLKLFVGAAQMGMACGLTHPWEWFSHALRTSHILPHDDQKKFAQDTTDAFVAFWNGCGSHPDDPCQTAGANELFDEIDAWYKRAVK